MATQIRIRSGTTAQWSSANPTLAEGEMGINLDTSNFKIGDGTTAWNDLPYWLSDGLNPFLLMGV